MRFTRCLGLVATLLAAGCGQLSVRVDVLDREYVFAQAAEESLRSAYRDINKAQPGEFANRVDAKTSAYVRAVQNLSNKLETEGAKSAKLKSSLAVHAQTLRTGVQSEGVQRRSRETGQRLEDLAKAVRSAARGANWDGRGDIPPSVRLALADLQDKDLAFSAELEAEQRELTADLTRLKQQVAKEAKASGPASPESRALAAVATAEAAVISVVTQPSIGDPSFGSSEFAHIVASAPEDSWKVGFNRAIGTGQLGNLDVVIKMNSSSDFTVKGMRFDATTVAAVASKVLTQAVVLGAQMSGVPVSTNAGSSDPGTALAKASSELATVDATLARRNAAIDAQRSALRGLAGVIVAAKTQMDNDTFKGQGKDPRKSVHDIVDQTFTSLHDLIQLQGFE